MSKHKTISGTMTRSFMRHNSFHSLAYILVVWLCRRSLTVGVFAANAEPDLYKLLGVSRTATTKEIKQAYRRKARDTHPDKNKDVPPEQAAETFRQVVHAFEILSDSHSRQQYDRTGRTSSDTNGGGRQNYQQHYQWSQFFNRRPVRLKDQFRVQEAMSRVLHMLSLEQLQLVMLDDQDLLERHLLMVFCTPGDVEKLTDDEMVFPYPFAGMSSQGIWWEDLLQTAKVRFHKGNDLTKFFNIPTGDELRASGKPIFLYGRKGEPLSPDNMQRLQTGSRKELEAWVWKNVEVPVLFWNRHNHPIQIYWIHGSRAHIKDTLQPGAQAWHTSMLTHEWYIRDARVDKFEGSPGDWKLSDDSSLWRGKLGTEDGPPIREDGTILVRVDFQMCFDLSGHCSFWKQQGECRKNPNFMNEKCQLTCGICKKGAKEEDGMDDEL